MKSICFGLLLAIASLNPNIWGQTKLLDLPTNPTLAQDLRNHPRPLVPLNLTPEEVKKYDAEPCGEYVAITFYKNVVGVICHLDSGEGQPSGLVNLRYEDLEVWLDESVHTPSLQLFPRGSNSTRYDAVLRLPKAMHQVAARCLPGPTPAHDH
jgi:hypothetical protein